MIKISKKMVRFTIISTLRDVSCLPAGRGIAENPSLIIWSGDNRGKAKVARSSGDLIMTGPIMTGPIMTTKRKGGTQLPSRRAVPPSAICDDDDDIVSITDLKPAH